MERWLEYARERFPLPAHLLTTGGMVLSGLFLAGGTFHLRGFLVSCLGFLLFFFQLRLMDDYRDYVKDTTAHPARPLPRGHVSLESARQAIVLLNLLMLTYGALVMVLTNRTASFTYFGLVVYLMLVHEGFFLGRRVEDRLLLRALLRHGMVFAACIFAVTVTRPEWFGSVQTLWLGLAIMGAALNHEICRKLDPGAHPVLKTYPAVYGRSVTFLVLAAACLAAGLGAWGLGLQKMLWPATGLVLLLSAWILFFAPQRHRVARGAAALSLLLHLWAVVIQRFAGWPA